MAVSEDLKDYRKRLKEFQGTFQKEIGDISTQQDKDIGVATDILAQRLKTETGVDPLGRKTGLPQQERREPRDIRRDLLTRGDAVRQATEELSPQYEAILGQLRENIASTRQAVPQELAARGQTLGGLRSATEAGLTREEAYQTAGLEAQRAADIQTRAGQILTAEQEAAATEQARQDALRQQEFQNQLALRSAQLQEQGFTADEAYRQATLELQQQQQAEQVRQFDVSQAEQQRQFGLEFGLEQQQAAADLAYRQAQMAQLSAERPDLSTYINAASGLQGQDRINYINNLQTRGLITTDDANQIKGMTGVTPGAVTPVETGRGRLGITETVGPETVIGGQAPVDITQPQTFNEWLSYQKFLDPQKSDMEILAEIMAGTILPGTETVPTGTEVAGDTYTNLVAEYDAIPKAEAFAEIQGTKDYYTTTLGLTEQQYNDLLNRYR